MKPRVALLYGGASSEHDVSRCSGASVARALLEKGYEIIAVGISRDGRWYVQDSPQIVDDPVFGSVLALEPTGVWHLSHFPMDNRIHFYNHDQGREYIADVVFPVLHGKNGEDGTVQGLLTLSDVPFVGPDHYSSALAMDKSRCKHVLRDADLPVVPWIDVTRHMYETESSDVMARMEELFDYPVFIKPNRAGSSVGVVKVKSRDDVEDAFAKAFAEDFSVIVEEAIEAREIECAVLGNADPKAALPGEIVPGAEFYSYEAKYVDAGASEIIIPANLNQELLDDIRDMAVEAFKACGLSGLSRVDFFIDKETNEIYMNEINTIPGFTGISMYPKMWEASGLSYGDLVEELVNLAMERHGTTAGT